MNKEEKQRESNKTFKALRKAHSAVESNINMLEHHGLDRCVDKGIEGYKRYVGLSVLAYNLHILGNHLVADERKKEETAPKAKRTLSSQSCLKHYLHRQQRRSYAQSLKHAIKSFHN